MFEDLRISLTEACQEYNIFVRKLIVKGRKLFNIVHVRVGRGNVSHSLVVEEASGS